MPEALPGASSSTVTPPHRAPGARLTACGAAWAAGAAAPVHLAPLPASRQASAAVPARAPLHRSALAAKPRGSLRLPPGIMLYGRGVNSSLHSRRAYALATSSTDSLPQLQCPALGTQEEDAIMTCTLQALHFESIKGLELRPEFKARQSDRADLPLGMANQHTRA